MEWKVEKKNIHNPIGGWYHVSNDETMITHLVNDATAAADLCRLLNGGWISMEERLPNEADTNAYGEVWAWDKILGYAVSLGIVELTKASVRYSHWQPLPPKPQTK